MQFFQTRPIQIAGMPIGVACCSNENVAIVALAPFKAIIDNPSKYSAKYFQDAMVVDGKEYDYNTWYNYKDDNVLLNWLKSQEMLMPE